MKHHRYSQASLAKLDTCDPRLKAVAMRGLELSPYDVKIVHGWRGKDVQNALRDSGVSYARWGDSPHNYMENGEPFSQAIDIAPVIDGVIPWKDTHIFAVVAGAFMAAAEELSTLVIWGGDWDSDGSTKDQTLLDYGHLELGIHG